MLSISYALVLGTKIVLDDLTPSETVNQVLDLRDQPGMVKVGYKVQAFRGDELVGDVTVEDGEIVVHEECTA